jgi:hypothetical protein
VFFVVNPDAKGGHLRIDASAVVVSRSSESRIKDFVDMILGMITSPARRSSVYLPEEGGNQAREYHETAFRDRCYSSRAAMDVGILITRSGKKIATYSGGDAPRDWKYSHTAMRPKYETNRTKDE